MPKIVDHDTRRTELLAAVCQLVARVGIEEANIRAIAAETGWSTGTLAHYFTNRDDIIEQTLKFVHLDQEQRLFRFANSTKPTDERSLLRSLLEVGLPLDKARRQEAAIEICFWAESLHSMRLHQLQGTELQRWIDGLEMIIARGVKRKAIDRSVKPPLAAKIVAAFADGLQLEAGLHPSQYPPRVIRTMLQEFLDRVVPHPDS